MGENRWDQRYIDGDLPWDSGTPAPQLAVVVERFSIAPCKALEVGCGTGTNAIWMAQQGFTVTATDLSSTAIEMAKNKATLVQCEFTAADFLEDPVPGGPFEFAFDRGCFHSFGSLSERGAFVDAMSRHLEPGGLWLSLIGSTDGPAREGGPPRRSAIDIATAVESKFEVILLETTTFEPVAQDSVRSWTALLRRRDG